ncbi:MAG: OprD family outer membrane porin [Deltaproteobacteria bacterium]|nr:OprD family outer membrane porin [Deltaproteobacteria bacterium]
MIDARQGHGGSKGVGLRLIVMLLLVFGISSFAVAAEGSKRMLKNNMTEVYHVLPEPAATFAEAFTKGVVYGRLRANYFKWYWADSSYDPEGFGLGGSLIYKTAPFYGVSATAGLYTSQNLGLLDDDDASGGKSGKDTFSRYDVLQNGRWGMTVLAQAYLQVHVLKSDFKIGRQIFESFLTKSNDTKMIPNTFEGYALVSKDLPKTQIKAAYFTGQKLRDHTEFHDVITYTDGRGETYSKWNNNDDSAVHKGLSHANLVAAGKDTDNDLVIVGVTNKSIRNLKLDAWYTGVPDLVYSLMGEANYKIALGGGWSITPGFRYMQQFDDGAGAVGGAALTGSLARTSGSAKGYKDAANVDGKLYAGRVVGKKGAGSLLAGYSEVSDDADLIAPWRGFPTGGYTRSMAQYNWEAETKSWMVKVFYDFGKAGFLDGFRAALDYAYMNYDDTKEQLAGHSKTDRGIIHADLWYKFPCLPALEAKVRIGLVNANATRTGSDPSYDEFRVEFNYLF